MVQTVKEALRKFCSEVKQTPLGRTTLLDSYGLPDESSKFARRLFTLLSPFWQMANCWDGHKEGV
jgi:hypothetical protein